MERDGMAKRKNGLLLALTAAVLAYVGWSQVSIGKAYATNVCNCQSSRQCQSPKRCFIIPGCVPNGIHYTGICE